MGKGRHMVKIFMTGDNHFGRSYDRYPEVREQLIQSRFKALENMLKKAETEGCAFFVITGDLFENINNIKVSDVKKIVNILAAFPGNVLILPGNHDYYAKDEKVWRDFEKAMSSLDHTITILKEFRVYEFEAGEENVVFYPALCRSKYGEGNNLTWIKETKIEADEMIHIGIAHGAIKGLTPDMNGQYFLMTPEELNAIPVDAWLIGHTHIPYPDCLLEDSDTKGYKIFNAGTHEQTDLHNMTEGDCFILSIEKTGNKATVLARKYKSGRIKYKDISIQLLPESETILSEKLKAAIENADENTVVRVKLSGTIKQNEYINRDKIYKELLGGFLTYEAEDSDLSEEITIEKIRTDYAQTSFAAQFLEKLIDNPLELQMAYDLLNECKEK